MSSFGNNEFFLTIYQSITNSPELVKLHNIVSKHGSSFSRDIFTKNVIIKCLESRIDSKLILASSNDIKVMNGLDDSYDLSAHYKLFIGNMINEVYNANPKIDGNVNLTEYMQEGAFTHIIKIIKKESIIEEIV